MPSLVFEIFQKVLKGLNSTLFLVFVIQLNLKRLNTRVYAYEDGMVWYSLPNQNDTNAQTVPLDPLDLANVPSVFSFLSKLISFLCSLISNLLKDGTLGRSKGSRGTLVYFVSFWLVRL